MFNAIKKLFFQTLFIIMIILIFLLSILNINNVHFNYIFGNINVPLISLLFIFFSFGLFMGYFINRFIKVIKSNNCFNDSSKK